MTSLFSRLFGERPPAPPEAKASRAAGLIAHMSMGLARWTPRNYVELTRQGYERNPIVYRSVRMIAEAAASIPWRAYDGREEIADHPLLKLVERPNPVDAGPAFFEALYSNLMLFGNAYVEAGLLDGAPRELYALRSDRMAVVPGPNGWPAAYDYMVAGEKVRYEMTARGVQPILQLKLFHPLDDHYGFSPLGAAQVPIDVHNSASGWTKALLDNSARPSGALVYTGAQGSTLSDEQFERLKAELEESFSGPRNAGRPLLLEGGLDWKALSLSPRDMDFMEAKAGAAREIALAFGVPPLLLGIPGDNKFSNYQEANRAFWRQTVIPLVARTQKSFGAWLEPAFGAVRLDYDVDRIDALSEERASEWTRVGAANFITTDEKREALGFGKAPKDGVSAMPKPAKQKPPMEVRYAPDQPRVPAGSGRESGRWGAGGGGGVDGAKPGAAAPAKSPTPKPVQAALNDAANIMSDAVPAAQREYSPDKPGWHDYTAGPNLVCPAEFRCTRSEMIDAFSRFAVPGQNPLVPAEDKGISEVYDPRTLMPSGQVKTYVSDDGSTIINVTEPGHLLYDGEVIRTLTQASDGSWHVTSHGVGNNVIPGMNWMNQMEGPQIFNYVDWLMFQYITAHHA